MHTIGRILFIAVSSAALLTGCGSKPAYTPTSPTTLPVATSRPETDTSLAKAVATAAGMPAPVITAIPTTGPVETATSPPTPQAQLLLAVPSEFYEATSAAVATFTPESSAGIWHVISSEDPGALLAKGGADAALVAGLEGAVVLERTLALEVPFATDWESTSEAEAREIIRDGHPLVSVGYWEEMRPSARPLRVNGYLPQEADYPFKDSWSILPAPNRQAAVAQLSNGLRAAMGTHPVVSLAAVGDIMLARTLGNALVGDNLAYPFERVQAVLQAADITVGNLESAIGTVGEPVAKHYAFRAPPQAAAALGLAGFDVIGLANNHALDYGPEALLEGISLLQEHDISVVGAGADSQAANQAQFQEIKGIKLAFLGYVNVPVEVGGFDTATWAASADTAGLAWGEPTAISQHVAAASRMADIVIVLLHSGYEYVEAPSDPQVAAAHAAIDAGAALVIGHHAHILQGVEFYKDGVIVYGLGNFAFDITGPGESAIVRLWLDQKGVRQLEIIPVIIQTGGQPRLAEPWEATPIRRQVYHLTRLLNAP